MPVWMRHREAASYLGVSVWHLAAMRGRGDGPPYYRLGMRLIGYRRDDLDVWLAARRCQSTLDAIPTPVPPTTLERSLAEDGA
jgi:hypothetical protein